MVRTRVGYAGGTTPTPTYHNLGDHTETLQLDYDADATSFEQLLEIFWDTHEPTRPAWSRQYMAAVFFRGDEQEKAARKSRDHQTAKRPGRITTRILPESGFHHAEAYHQKYYLRQAPELMRELTAIYPRKEDLLASTTAARLNGYLAGRGMWQELQAELPGFGLSGTAVEKLRGMVRNGN